MAVRKSIPKSPPPSPKPAGSVTQVTPAPRVSLSYTWTKLDFGLATLENLVSGVQIFDRIESAEEREQLSLSYETVLIHAVENVKGLVSKLRKEAVAAKGGAE